MSDIRLGAVCVMLAVGVAGCVPESLPTLEERAQIWVTVKTTGAGRDPDGYRVTLDNLWYTPVSPDSGRAIFPTAAGDHQVLLDGVAPYCTVSGSNPWTVSVTPGVIAQIRFDVSCAAAPPPGGGGGL